MSAAAQHAAWWLRNIPASRPHRDDITQECVIAAWEAAADFDESRGVKLTTFAWRRMYGAVRAYLQAAGVIQWRVGRNGARSFAPLQVADPPEMPGADRTDEPLVLAEAWGALIDGYTRRGFTAGHAEALARLDVGQTFAEAGAAVGLSRQRVHQVATLAGVHATFTRGAA